MLYLCVLTDFRNRNSNSSLNSYFELSCSSDRIQLSLRQFFQATFLVQCHDFGLIEIRSHEEVSEVQRLLSHGRRRSWKSKGETKESLSIDRRNWVADQDMNPIYVPWLCEASILLSMGEGKIMGKVFQCQRTRLASSMTPDMHFQVSVSIFKYVTNDKSSLAR